MNQKRVASSDYKDYLFPLDGTNSFFIFFYFYFLAYG